MKVAVATDGNRVAQHFGRCPAYTIATIEDGKLKGTEVIPNPGHEPGFLPRYLAERGISCIIAGGMGPRAQNLFAQENIQTFIGVEGTVEEVLAAYLQQTLTSGESLCEHGQAEDTGCRH